MKDDHVTVIYRWTANEGKLDELTSIYDDVTAAMEENEPGATAVHVHVSAADNAIWVRDEFADSDAMAFHLQTTAAAHFPSLLAIATPGPFVFMGDVPEGLQAATQQMGLPSQFAPHRVGFDRSAVA